MYNLNPSWRSDLTHEQSDLEYIAWRSPAIHSFLKIGNPAFILQTNTKRMFAIAINHERSAKATPSGNTPVVWGQSKKVAKRYRFSKPTIWFGQMLQPMRLWSTKKVHFR